MRFDLQLFTPGEAESITGASTALHRDWRRRGILPANEGTRHARFSTKDVAHLLALRSFSEANLSVIDAGEAAQAASLMTVDMLVPLFCDDWHLHRFPWTPREKRFVIITDQHILEAWNLADLAPMLAREGGSPVIVIYDCLLAARRIIELAARPVFVEVPHE